MDCKRQRSGWMLISLCTPVMNRLDDLRRVMPSRIACANESPPVEICILDWSSNDGLQDYMDELIEIARLAPGSSITYRRVDGKRYWHSSKAFNMAGLMGSGEHIIIVGADHGPKQGYIPIVRKLISDGV